MMTNEKNGFGAPMGPTDGDGTIDSAEDFALWELMSVLEDVPPRHDFLEAVQSQTLDRTMNHRPWYRRGWAPAAAAVLMIAIAMTFALENSSRNSKGGHGGPENVAEYQGVVDLLGGLSDADVLALDANDTEIVQDDWFGD